MNPSIEAARRERIDAVLALAAPRLQPAQRAHVEAFARAYFHHLDADDLAARSPEDLLGALLSHWQFGAERAPGTTRLRVLSPSLAEQGWASRHTVIEIVNDDMPFLVDSTTMEINRQGLTLHLIVHPILVVERDAQGSCSRCASCAPTRPTRARRANRGCTSRSTAWSTRRSAPSWRPGWSACSATCAPRCATGSRCASGCTRPSPSWKPRRRRCRRRWPPKAAPSCNGWPTTT